MISFWRRTRARSWAMASASISAWVPRRGTVWLERRWMVWVVVRVRVRAAVRAANMVYFCGGIFLRRAIG